MEEEPDENRLMVRGRIIERRQDAVTGTWRFSASQGCFATSHILSPGKSKPGRICHKTEMVPD
jgi:hypothetical protein